MTKLFNPQDVADATGAMQVLAGLVDVALHNGEVPPPRPPELAFFLIVAEVGTPGGRINYVGNINEAQTVDLLQRTKERFEALLAKAEGCP